ncbi:protein IQ-DOMAIN 3-like [Rutidosis leptorrhynchoides]|uniref:protein IQ-DOMAIN 3-like n=1 Tax=Rutidosis leptorrhynchoides TaxID=125765 RepID=UPI003A9931EF
MGKKSWFSAVKKAVTPSCTKFKKNKRSHKSKSNPKKTWQYQTQATLANPTQNYYPKEEIEFKYPETEQIKDVDPVSYAVPMDVDTTSPAPVEVNYITSNPRFIGKSKEEISAIKIQSAYRGYQARRVVRTMRAQRRLRLWIKGQAVKRQTTSTLMTIQTMSRVQSQVRNRKIRMAEVNEALQRQLQQKREKTFEKERDFDLSPISKEQLEARLRNKKDTAERREKALAYAFVRQQTWRNRQKSANSTVFDDWEWNWSERWNAIRPWETETANNKRIVSSQTSHNHKVSTKSLISKPAPSPLGSGKKGSLKTKSGDGLTKKRNLFSNLASSGGKRSLSAPAKNLRWKL